MKHFLILPMYVYYILESSLYKVSVLIIIKYFSKRYVQKIKIDSRRSDGIVRLRESVFRFLYFIC